MRSIKEMDKRLDEREQEITELNENITWWQNRFNAVERDNKQLKEEKNKLRNYIEELDDLLFYLRHNILQITSGVTEYDDDNLEEVFNENAKLKIKINKAIEWVNNIQQDKNHKHLEPYIATDTLDELLEILGDKE